MKILFDDQIFTIQHYGGISSYFCELMERFSHDPAIDFRVALRYTLNEPLLSHGELNRYWTHRNDLFSDSRFFSGIQKKVRVNALNHIFRNRAESIRQLKGQDFDLFHPTYYDPYFLAHLGDRPFVLTIYDMILERFSDRYPQEGTVRKGKKLLAEKASRIIAISDSTKKDIIRFLEISEDKIQTIHLASSLSSTQGTGPSPSPMHSNLPERFLLFVGNRPGYKNFPFLIRALHRFFDKEHGLYLVCAGGGGFSEEEMRMIRELGIFSRVLHYPADDATLSYLYAHAIAFVFPSLCEGFGLPILDSFSCGCPALLSNTSSFPEVGGDAALYFDPIDPASLITSVERLLSDEHLREELIVKGRERGKLFSWEKTAAMTREVYESASE